MLEHLAQLESLGRQLRPELATQNHRHEPAAGLAYCTWANPQACSEGGQIIQEYTYFYYAKPAAGNLKHLLETYYCCLKCWERLKPTEGLRYPSNKIEQKQLPQRERVPFWLDIETGKKYDRPQYKKIPLNPDAFILSSDQMDEEIAINIRRDQEEIVRA